MNSSADDCPRTRLTRKALWLQSLAIVSSTYWPSCNVADTTRAQAWSCPDSEGHLHMSWWIICWEGHSTVYRMVLNGWLRTCHDSPCGDVVLYFNKKNCAVGHIGVPSPFVVVCVITLAKVIDSVVTRKGSISVNFAKGRFFLVVPEPCKYPFHSGPILILSGLFVHEVRCGVVWFTWVHVMTWHSWLVLTLQTRP